MLVGDLASTGRPQYVDASRGRVGQQSRDGLQAGLPSLGIARGDAPVVEREHFDFAGGLRTEQSAMAFIERQLACRCAEHARVQSGRREG